MAKGTDLANSAMKRLEGLDVELISVDQLLAMAQVEATLSVGAAIIRSSIEINKRLDDLVDDQTYADHMQN